MTADVRIGGELYLRIEDAAACFELEARFVEEACALGALGPALTYEERRLLPARELDRLARLVHLSRVHGVELYLAAAWLERGP